MTLRKLHRLKFAKLTRKNEADFHAHLLKAHSLCFLDFALVIAALII